jgi:hypothetical protein
MLEMGFATQEDFKEFCLQLLKRMYVNDDAALRFFKTYSANDEDEAITGRSLRLLQAK